MLEIGQLDSIRRRDDWEVGVYHNHITNYVFSIVVWKTRTRRRKPTGLSRGWAKRNPRKAVPPNNASERRELIFN